ncbi:MAG: hypothetical protein ACNS63_07440 [Candidatus Nitrospinota bacterium M3_3B_026]
MTEKNEGSSSGEDRPPNPDAPAPPESRESAGRAGDARRRMADYVESGRSPYDYGFEEEDRGRERSSRAILSLANVAAVVSLAAVLAVGFMAWKVAGDVSGEMERLNAAVRKLSGQLRAQREEGRAASAAAARAELRQTLNALDEAIALGGPEAAERARELKDETLGLLAVLGSDAGKRAPEEGRAGIFVAPGADALAPGAEEESPLMEEPVETEEPAVVMEEGPGAPEPGDVGEYLPEEEEIGVDEPVTGLEEEQSPAGMEEPMDAEAGTPEEGESDGDIMEPLSPLDIETQPIESEERGTGL